MANQEDDFPRAKTRGSYDSYDPCKQIESVKEIRNGIFLKDVYNRNYYKVVSDQFEYNQFDDDGDVVCNIKIKVKKCKDIFVEKQQVVLPNTRFYEDIIIHERVPSVKSMTLVGCLYSFFRVNNRYIKRTKRRIYDDGDNEVLDYDPRWEHPEDF